MRKAIPALMLLAVCLPAYSAGVYKWTDENGVIHYSDKKPQNLESTEMRVRSGPASTNQRQSAQEQGEELDKRNEVEQLRARQAEETEAAKKRQQERCEAVRANLQTLNNNARIRIEGEDGQLRFLAPEEIIERRNESQAILDAECQ